MMYHKEVGVDPCNYVTFDTIDNIDIMLDWCIAEPVNVMPNDEIRVLHPLPWQEGAHRADHPQHGAD